MTKKELGEVLYIVNTNYGKRLAPEEAKAQARLWYGAFGNFEADVLRSAVQLHITDKRVGMYYPTIAHITAKIERARSKTTISAVNAPRRAEITAGRTTPETTGAVAWLMDVFENKGEGFYSDSDEPCNPEEVTK